MTWLLHGNLEPDDKIASSCECVSGARGRAWFAVTNRHVAWVDDTPPDGTVKLLPHEYLVGYRLQAGYLRLGWQADTDPTPLLLTMQVRSRPEVLLTTFAALTREWSKQVGRPFPNDEFRTTPAIPDLELTPRR